MHFFEYLNLQFDKLVNKFHLLIDIELLCLDHLQKHLIKERKDYELRADFPLNLLDGSYFLVELVRAVDAPPILDSIQVLKVTPAPRDAPQKTVKLLVGHIYAGATLNYFNHGSIEKPLFMNVDIVLVAGVDFLNMGHYLMQFLF